MNVKREVRGPECGSKHVWKDGIRYTNYGEVQRYICRDCGYRFSSKQTMRDLKLTSFLASQCG
jgi:transposase-like protein